MPQQKTSQSRIYSFRLNPINAYEKQVIDIFDYWLTQSVGHKQVIVDRVLRGEGHTPEMYESETAPLAARLAAQLEPMLKQFAYELLKNYPAAQGTGARRVPEDDDNEVTQFTRNFARGFLQRSREVVGDDEE